MKRATKYFTFGALNFWIPFRNQKRWRPAKIGIQKYKKWIPNLPTIHLLNLTTRKKVSSSFFNRLLQCIHHQSRFVNLSRFTSNKPPASQLKDQNTCDSNWWSKSFDKNRRLKTLASPSSFTRAVKSKLDGFEKLKDGFLYNFSFLRKRGALLLISILKLLRLLIGLFLFCSASSSWAEMWMIPALKFRRQIAKEDAKRHSNFNLDCIILCFLLERNHSKRLRDTREVKLVRNVEIWETHLIKAP